MNIYVRILHTLYEGPILSPMFIYVYVREHTYIQTFTYTTSRTNWHRRSA